MLKIYNAGCYVGSLLILLPMLKITLLKRAKIIAFPLIMVQSQIEVRTNIIFNLFYIFIDNIYCLTIYRIDFTS